MNKIRKIFIVFLIFFIFSTSVYSAVNLSKSVPGHPYVKAAVYLVGSLMLSKYGKKILGAFDDWFFDGDSVVYVGGGKYCATFFRNGRFENACVDNTAQARNAMLMVYADDDDIKVKNCEFPKHSILGRDHSLILCSFNILSRKDNRDYSQSFSCPSCQRKEVDIDVIVNYTVEQYKKGDPDAEPVIEKAREIEESENNKKNNNSNDDSRNDSESDSNSDSDSNSRKDKDDKDDKDDKSSSEPVSSDDSDDNKIIDCDYSSFHRKVCEWIDWTQEEPDDLPDSKKVEVQDDSQDPPPYKDYVKFDSRCPFRSTDDHVTIGGNESKFSYDFEYWCEIVIELKPIVIASGALISFFIVTGYYRQNNEE